MSPTPITLRATLILAATVVLSAQPQLEHLGRGVVAIHQPDGKVAVSWRLLGTDPAGVAFNLYRKSEFVPGRFGPANPGIPPGGVGPSASGSGRPPGGSAAAPGAGRGPGGRGGFPGAAPGEPVRLNREPLAGPTFFVDETANLAFKTSYFVRAVVGGQEQDPRAAFTLSAPARARVVVRRSTSTRVIRDPRAGRSAPG